MTTPAKLQGDLHPHRPLVDLELAEIFAIIGNSASSVTPETLATMRAVAVSNTLSVDDLRRAGLVDVRDLTVPGATGRPTWRW